MIAYTGLFRMFTENARLYETVPVFGRLMGFFSNQSSHENPKTAVVLLLYGAVDGAMAWAASPDPVDFRKFMNMDLYARDANFYYDPDGSLHPGIRSDTLFFSLLDWIRMEEAHGDGGQFQSFEAVFGRKAANGLPEPLFDRETGKILPKTVKSWKAYDINRILLKQGASLKKKLDGKITLIVADNDPFFLDEPVKNLAQTCREIGIDIDIRILSDRGHNTWTKELREEMHRKMDATLLHQGNGGILP